MLDAEAFELLYRDQEKRLYNVAYRWTWNAADASELVQEAFMRIWARRFFIEPNRAGAYAARIVVNLCRKQARRARRWEPVRQVLKIRSPVSRDPASSYERDAIRHAIESLPDIQRHVLLLTEFTDLKQVEIGDLLGIPAGTVASRRNTAVRHLKEQFNEQ